MILMFLVKKLECMIFINFIDNVIFFYIFSNSKLILFDIGGYIEDPNINTKKLKKITLEKFKI